MMLAHLGQCPSLARVLAGSTVRLAHLTNMDRRSRIISDIATPIDGILEWQFG